MDGLKIQEITKKIAPAYYLPGARLETPDKVDEMFWNKRYWTQSSALTAARRAVVEIASRAAQDGKKIILAVNDKPYATINAQPQKDVVSDAAAAQRIP